MDLPDDHIVFAFLQQPAGLRDALDEEQAHQEETGGLRQPITHEVRPNGAHNGDGDGLHINNIQLDLAENGSPFAFIFRRFYSRLWHYAPMFVLMSSLIIKCILNVLGIDTQNSTLLGIPFKSHLNAVQWTVLIATYYFKSRSH